MLEVAAIRIYSSNGALSVFLFWFMDQSYKYRFLAQCWVKSFFQVNLPNIISVMKTANTFTCLCDMQCCNLSVSFALNVRFTTIGMCAKNNTPIHMARISNSRVIMACDLSCCHSVKLCALAARAFRSQQQYNHISYNYHISCRFQISSSL